MSIADTAAALGAAHTDATSQETDITKMIKQAEQAQARLRDAAAGAANPLAERAVGNYANAIVKLREGAALLAEVTTILTEYARTTGIDLPGDNVEPAIDASDGPASTRSRESDDRAAPGPAET
jgi:hypothetical protein